METPLVSIVLPTHNGSRYLRQSIDSCLQQTYGALELVVVDDASSDETSEILTSYDDPRIRVVRNEVNQGLPESLNIGFAASTGEYLTWTSDDNYYAPDAIARLASELTADAELGLVYGSFYCIDEQGEVIERKNSVPPVYLPREDTVGAYFMYRRKVKEAVGGYDSSVRLAEDYDYWLRIYKQFPVKLVDADGYYYRQHGLSLTGTSGRRKIMQITKRVQRKNNTIRMSVGCLAYSMLDPISGLLTRTGVGAKLRARFGGVWRKYGGR